MGKLILQECAFNSVNGNDPDKNALAYSPVTSCATVTCICDDGTIAGGHIPIIPFCLWYVLSNLANIIKTKNVTTICILGSDVWENVNNLEELFEDPSDGNFYPDKRIDGMPTGGNVANERNYLGEVITFRGGISGLQAVVTTILGLKSPNFMSALYDDELHIEFQGSANAVIQHVNGKLTTIPYVPNTTQNEN